MSIAVGDNFELMYPGDDGFIVDDILVRGGYSIVSTLTERDNIPLSARKEGMVVYVQTPKLEYQLVDGIDNTNWAVYNTMIDDGKTFARLDSPAFTGNMTYTQPDKSSGAVITKVTEVYSGDSDVSFLEIALTEAERATIGMYTSIKGENSGGVAIILEVRPNGIVIPSKTAPVSKPEYRIGSFLQSERVVFSAGAVIAQNEKQVVTLAGLNANAISKLGGKIFGQLELRPVYRYVSEATISGIEKIESLGVAYVKMAFTATDLAHVHNAMTIQIITDAESISNDTLTTIRMMTSKQGFIIDLNDLNKISVGKKIKVMSSVKMPTQANHVVSKEYVDTITRAVTLKMKATSFVKFAQAYDPIKKAQRQLSRYIISKELFSKDHLPLFKLYKDYEVDSYTYKYEIKSEDIRVSLRSLGTTNYELVIEFWDMEAYDCEIHVI